MGPPAVLHQPGLPNLLPASLTVGTGCFPHLVIKWKLVCPVTGLIAPWGIVRLMLDCGSVILAPELVTDVHFVKRFSVNIDVLLGIGVEDCSLPVILSKVPAEPGLIFPEMINVHFENKTGAGSS